MPITARLRFWRNYHFWDPVNDPQKIICWYGFSSFYTRSNFAVQIKKEKISQISHSNLFKFWVCIYMFFCSNNSFRVQTGYILDGLSGLRVMCWRQRPFHLLIDNREARHHCSVGLLPSLGLWFLTVPLKKNSITGTPRLTNPSGISPLQGNWLCLKQVLLYNHIKQP